MPVVSSYRPNRLWHKGEIAEKGSRKQEKRSIFRPIVTSGLVICSPCLNRGFRSNGKQSAYKKRLIKSCTCSNIPILLVKAVCFYPHKSQTYHRPSNAWNDFHLSPANRSQLTSRGRGALPVRALKVALSLVLQQIIGGLWTMVLSVLYYDNIIKGSHRFSKSHDVHHISHVDNWMVALKPKLCNLF